MIDIQIKRTSDFSELQSFACAQTPMLTSNYEEIFLGKKVYPALEISYVDMAQHQDFAGCLFITVEAMINKPYSAVGFYENCYFAPCEYLNPNKGTLRMFRTLYPD